MAYVLETPLGRRVDNRWAGWKDVVLYALYRWHRDPFNSGDIPITVERITSDAVSDGYENLGEREIKDICEKLLKEDYVGKVENSGLFYYRITPEGVEYVEKLLTKL